MKKLLLILIISHNALACNKMPDEYHNPVFDYEFHPGSAEVPPTGRTSFSYSAVALAGDADKEPITVIFYDTIPGINVEGDTLTLYTTSYQLNTIVTNNAAQGTYFIPIVCTSPGTGRREFGLKIRVW